MTARVVPDLARTLHARIAADGPMTFADFMDAALYDPVHGFYPTHDIGREGEFVTSPHLSDVFGRLLARQVGEFQRELGGPDPFHVVEIGAGDGTLARQILRGLNDAARQAVRYVAVERATAARARLASVEAVEAVGRLDDVPTGGAGCVLANELLDNLPFHRVRGTKDGPRELFVDTDGDRFLLVEGEPSSEEIADVTRDLGPGEERVVPVAAWGVLERAAVLIERGFLWFCDYGFATAEAGRAAPVHGYRGHRIEDDVLADPGTRDITAGVDFSSLASRAATIGLRAWGPVTQRSALLALGFRKMAAEARAHQAEALDERRGLDAIRMYSARNRANLLVARPGLGDFLVLCLGKDADEPPPSFAAAMRFDEDSNGT